MEDLPEKSILQPRPEDDADKPGDSPDELAPLGEAVSPPEEQRPAEPEPATPPAAESPEAALAESAQSSPSEAAPTSAEQPVAAAAEAPEETATEQPVQSVVEAAEEIAAEAPEEAVAEQPVEPAPAPPAEQVASGQPEEIVPAEPMDAAAAEPAETVAAEAAETVTVELAEPAAAKAQETAPPQGTVEQPAAPQPTGRRMGDLRSGMVVEGTVTRIERYGAFVNLGLVDRRDGLIHISEMSPHRIRRVEDVVRVGDEVRARVVAVDMQRGRISLSLNDVDEDLGAAEAASGPAEPTLTAMQLAFERAFGRRREEQGQQPNRSRREDVGDKRKREHESLMDRLRTGGR